MALVFLDILCKLPILDRSELSLLWSFAKLPLLSLNCLCRSTWCDYLDFEEAAPDALGRRLVLRVAARFFAAALPLSFSRGAVSGT